MTRGEDSAEESEGYRQNFCTWVASAYVVKSSNLGLKAAVHRLLGDPGAV